MFHIVCLFFLFLFVLLHGFSSCLFSALLSGFRLIVWFLSGCPVLSAFVLLVLFGVGCGKFWPSSRSRSSNSNIPFLYSESTIIKGQIKSSVFSSKSCSLNLLFLSNFPSRFSKAWCQNTQGLLSFWNIFNIFKVNV